MMALPATRRFDPLTGKEKAAILLLAVGQDKAAKLCSLLARDEVVALTRTMLAVGEVEPVIVDRLLCEFKGRLDGPAAVVGGVAATQKLLAATLGSDAVAPILSEIHGGPATGSVWVELAAINDDVLAAYLENEHPQTAALILSRLSPEQSARVLARLQAGLATEVVLRVLRLDVVEDEVLADVERTLQEELTAGLAGSGRDAHKAVALIFDQLDRSTESRLMQSLEAQNKDAAERVRAHMFTFADLGRVEAAGIQLLIRSAGNDRLTRALKGAGEPLRDLFLANMAERSAKMLREEMQNLGPIRLKDVEEAQQFLVNMAKELAASGQITLTSAEEEELIE